MDLREKEKRNQRHKGGYYGSLWVINTNGDSLGLTHLNATKKIECYLWRFAAKWLG